MTEFKKVSALAQDVEDVAKLLMSVPGQRTEGNSGDDDSNSNIPDSASSARALQTAAEKYKVETDSLRQRTDKLLAKAREKDPALQMYNEATCAKIEALGVEVDRVLQIATAERIAEIEASFLSSLRAEQHHQAAAEATSKSIGELQQQENDRRRLVHDDQRRENNELSVAEGKSRTDAYRLAAERAAAIWAAELRRRQIELESARAVTAAARANPKEFVMKSFCEQHLARLQSAECRSFLLARVREIVDALTRDPEQEGLRTMRTDSEKFTKTFGHSCMLRASVGADGADGDSATEERLAVAAAESIFFAIGYEIAYTASPMTFWAADTPSFRCEATKGAVLLRKHLIPWLQSGDRRLVLVEPPVAESPDEWIAWHSTLKSVNQQLQTLKP